MNTATNEQSQGAPFDYIKEACVTASGNFHGDKVPLYMLKAILNNAIDALNALDAIKKSLFYGREFPTDCGFSIHEVTVGCQSVPNKIGIEGESILHSIIGAATEAGELLELLKAVVFENKQFDDVNFIEEIGDGFWYAAIGLNAVNCNFHEAQSRNIAKLRHRFPNAFNEYDANNRDIFAERKILETSSKPVAQMHEWSIVNNRLVGRVSNHPRQHEFTQPYVTTSEIVKLDEEKGICETKNTIYQLGKHTAFSGSDDFKVLQQA